MISAIILAKNSASTLDKTLKSLSWCDEIILIDDGSTDDTSSLAKKAGATVFIHKANDDFAAQRNWALEKAKHEWVFFVDSDEIVTKELALEIQKKLSELRITDYELRGFYIKRKDYLFGQWLKFGETGRVNLLRLAKKDAGTWERPVHEVWNISGPTENLSHPLLHYPHPNVAQFIDEINRYSTLNARFLKSQGIHASWWHILAYPKAKFFVDYIWYLGFLDGTAGAVLAIIMSMHSFLTRAKLYFLWKRS